jgi:hypothetical protein
LDSQIDFWWLKSDRLDVKVEHKVGQFLQLEQERSKNIYRNCLLPVLSCYPMV